jgi:acetoin:2,6-dichlorophenolindophenol oxidoreductase subunit beta
VLAPSNALDLAGLLRTAVRCDDPVVFLEPKNFFRNQADMPDDWPAIEIGKAAHLMRGDNLTLVSWSQAMPEAATAAKALAAEGTGVDLFDLRSLWPWDHQAIVASVNRTGRLLVVHEGVAAGGFGAEVIAHVSEHATGLRTARRIGWPRIPMPFARTLEAACAIEPARIAATAKAML